MRLYHREQHEAYRNYSFLLVAQALFVLTPLIYLIIPVEWLTIGMLAFVLMASVYIVTNTGWQLLLGIALGAVIILTLLIDLSAEGDGFAIVGNFGSMLYFLYAGVLLAKRIGESPRIDLNILMAAVAGYIFLGMLGAHLVEIVALLEPNSFTAPMTGSYTPIYFSFVTITTLGYGDISPVTQAARACSMALAICGQLYLTIIIAVIIGRLLGQDFDDD